MSKKNQFQASSTSTPLHSGVRVSPFYGSGDYVWAIVADNWKNSWGPNPLFGHVSADDEFTAARAAMDTGIFPYTTGLRPKPIRITSRTS